MFIDQARAIIITMQFINVNNANLMKYQVVAQKTDAGLYSLEFNTEQTTLKIFQTPRDSLIAILIIIFDILIILISMVDIKN